MPQFQYVRKKKIFEVVQNPMNLNIRIIRLKLWKKLRDSTQVHQFVIEKPLGFMPSISTTKSIFLPGRYMKVYQKKKNKNLHITFFEREMCRGKFYRQCSSKIEYLLYIKIHKGTRATEQPHVCEKCSKYKRVFNKCGFIIKICLELISICSCMDEPTNNIKNDVP